MPFHPPAQVRTGGPALLADRRDQLALTHGISSRNKHFRQVQIGRDQALTMVDQDQSALEMQARFGEGDHSGGGGANGRPDRGRQINPKMGTLWLAVEYALPAEARRTARALDRQDETALEGVQIGQAGKACGLALALGDEAGQKDGILGRDLIGRQAVDALDVEGPGRDDRFVGGRAVGGGHGDMDEWRGVAVEADHEPAVGRGQADDLAVNVDGGAVRGAAYGVAALRELTGQGEARRGGSGGGRQTADG